MFPFYFLHIGLWLQYFAGPLYKYRPEFLTSWHNLLCRRLLPPTRLYSFHSFIINLHKLTTSPHPDPTSDCQGFHVPTWPWIRDTTDKDRWSLMQLVCEKNRKDVADRSATIKDQRKDRPSSTVFPWIPPFCPFHPSLGPPCSTYSNLLFWLVFLLNTI